MFEFAGDGYGGGWRENVVGSGYVCGFPKSLGLSKSSGLLTVSFGKTPCFSRSLLQTRDDDSGILNYKATAHTKERDGLIVLLSLRVGGKMGRKGG